MTFKQVEKVLLKEGWYRYNVVGSHYQYKHNNLHGKITIPRHCKELKKGTLNSIFKQAGIKEFKDKVIK